MPQNDIMTQSRRGERGISDFHAWWCPHGAWGVIKKGKAIKGSAFFYFLANRGINYLYALSQITSLSSCQSDQDILKGMEYNYSG